MSESNCQYRNCTEVLSHHAYFIFMKLEVCQAVHSTHQNNEHNRHKRENHEVDYHKYSRENFMLEPQQGITNENGSANRNYVNDCPARDYSLLPSKGCIQPSVGNTTNEKFTKCQALVHVLVGEVVHQVVQVFILLVPKDVHLYAPLHNLHIQRNQDHQPFDGSYNVEELHKWSNAITIVTIIC